MKIQKAIPTVMRNFLSYLMVFKRKIKEINKYTHPSTLAQAPIIKQIKENKR
ncbi:hypothetical protein JCM12298_11590 [Desulfothermus naphthae]